MVTEYRVEKDLLGEKEIPCEAYWGIHTARAIENFAISGQPVPARMIQAIAMVKRACCQTNVELNYLEKDVAAAITQACDEIIAGQWINEFPIDAMQGGAGTSTNMNLNEVIANRAGELLGQPRGSYRRVHPIEDVNRHQSTNDVYPTALKIAAIQGLRELSGAIARLQGACQQKEQEFAAVITMGRTEFQDAVPITLGGQFASFAEAFARDRWRTFKCEERLRVVNIGGTAVGTGLTAPRAYIFLVIERLRDITGLGLTRGEQIMDQTANADCFVEASGMLKAYGANLIKVSRDLRFLHYLGEIALPPCQAGSSIMPGKVNPVLLESAISASMRVLANDTMIADAVSRGSLQINEFMPLIAMGILESINMLEALSNRLQSHFRRISANPEICRANLSGSSALITAFLPHIGYQKAEDLLKEFQSRADSPSFMDFLRHKLGSDLVEKVLNPHNLMALGHRLP